MNKLTACLKLTFVLVLSLCIGCNISFLAGSNNGDASQDDSSLNSVDDDDVLTDAGLVIEEVPEDAVTDCLDGISNEEVVLSYAPVFPMQDILFVIDDSTSMTTYLDALQAAFSSFFESAERMQMNYRIAFTTTLGSNELNCNAEEFDGCALDENSGLHSACLNGEWLLQPMMDNIESRFECNFMATIENTVTPIRNESSIRESGLRAAYEFFVRSGEGGENAGFDRPGVPNKIVIISDEVDHSSGSISDYVERLSSFSQNESTEVSAIGIGIGTNPISLVQCTSGGEDTFLLDRYRTVADQTNGLFETLCEEDHSAVLDWILEDSPTSYHLSDTPVVETVVVCEANEGTCVNIRDDYTYNEETNSIVFPAEATFDSNLRVNITYKKPCEA